MSAHPISSVHRAALVSRRRGLGGAPRARQRGFTLTELMIALVLGLLVVLAATAMVVTSRGTYRTQDESTRLAENARFALELVNRLVRLTGYTNFGSSTFPAASYQDVDYTAWMVAPDAYAFNGPQVVGANDSVPGGGTSVNGSDSLVLRYYGASRYDVATGKPGGPADGSILDCAGFPVPQPSDNAAAYSAARNYNVLYVANDQGEPALWCRRMVFDAATGLPQAGPVFQDQVLIRGVEDFQVLYGELIPQPAPNDDLDKFDPAAIVYRTGIGGPNPVTNWNHVRTLRIAMVLRSATGARPEPEATSATYNLFGSVYGASSDPGAQLALTSASQPDRTRLRQVVQTTVDLRNHVAPYQSLQQP